MDTLPSIFVAHGSPMTLDDKAWLGEFARWGQSLPRPSAILVVSAHWEARPVTIGATRQVPLFYDFYGFPQRFYEVQYPAPGAPALAARIRALLGKEGVADEPTRGLDHGAYIPLIPMFPKADVPVLQISLPSEDPVTLLELGRKLAPLRSEGVLIMGSGFLTHNLRTLDWSPQAKPLAWAVEFDAWCADVISRRDVDALMKYRLEAPGVRMALPTHEHFIPLIVAMGAALDGSATPEFPIGGFTYGSMTKRSVQFA